MMSWTAPDFTSKTSVTSVRLLNPTTTRMRLVIPSLDVLKKEKRLRMRLLPVC
jgi:hypothetical protein